MKEKVPRRKPSAGLWIVLIVVGAASFYLSTKYLEATKARNVTVVVVQMTDKDLTAYCPPSVECTTPPFLTIPVGRRCTFRDEGGKFVRPDAFSVSPEEPGAFSVTLLPGGEASKVVKMQNPFSERGEVRGIGETMQVNDKNYIVEDALVLYGGQPSPAPVSLGDEVLVYGYGERGLVICILQEGGTLSVESNVPGAKVYVDRLYRGTAPFEIPLSPGEKSIVLRAPGYEDGVCSVKIDSGSVTPVKIELKELTGTLRVETTPAGASVLVGGEKKGTAPLALELAPGSHVIEVALDGYHTQQRQVLVLAEIPSHISFALKRASSKQDASPGVQVLVLGSDLAEGTLEVRYPDGRIGNVGVQGGRLDGWPFTMAKLRGIRPGDTLYLEFKGDGALQDAYKGDNSRFTAAGPIMDRVGNDLWIGEGWVPCSLGPGTVFRQGTGFCSGDDLGKGDVITVYGPSPQEITLAEIHSRAKGGSLQEGYLVEQAGSLGIVLRDGEFRRPFSGQEKVVDTKTKGTIPVSEAPRGSLLKYRVDSEGHVTWAEFVYKADFSAQGRLVKATGAGLLLAPGWERPVINVDTLVFVNGKRTEFFDVKPGDLLLAAGPRENDVRFIWIQDRTGFDEVLPATVTGASSPKGLLLTSGGNVPVVLPVGVKVYDPRGGNILSPDSLNPGDTLVLRRDKGKVVWAELAQATDGVLYGRYLGERGGLMYFAEGGAVVGMALGRDAFVGGLLPGESLEVGAKVVASWRGEQVCYLEIQDNVRTHDTVSGHILDTTEGICLSTGWGLRRFEPSEDAWYFDRNLRLSGSIGELTLGDRVTLARDGQGRVLWCERESQQDFQVTGAIVRVEGYALVLEGEGFDGKVLLSKSAVVCKGGQLAGPYSLAPGDRVQVAGRNRNTIDFVYVEG